MGYAAIRERIASGLVLFLDADDLLQPDCLARMQQTLAHRRKWASWPDGSGAKRVCRSKRRCLRN